VDNRDSLSMVFALSLVRLFVSMRILEERKERKKETREDRRDSMRIFDLDTR